MKKKLKLSLYWFLGIVICSIFFWWIDRTFGWRQMLSVWRSITPFEMSIAVVLFVFSFVFRTLRIRDYFNIIGIPRFVTATRIALIHNFFNNFLPMRTGELAFPLFMQRYFAIPLIQSVPGLIWLRLLDFHLLLIVFLILFIFQNQFVLLSAIALMVLLPLPIFIRIISKRIYPYAVKYERMFFFKTVKHLLAGIPTQTMVLFKVWVWTLCNWVMKLCIFGWLMHNFIGISFFRGIIGSITGECSNVFMIHGFANAGTYEGGVVAGLLSLGIDFETAVKGATNLHLFILGTSVVGILLAYCALPVYKQKAIHEQHQ